MNMFVSSAALAAAAPAVAKNSIAHDALIDHQAILSRVEQIVDLLRTRYIREGWKIDEDGAARALGYFRRHVEGPPFKNEDEDTAKYHEALEFFRSHGQNLDWIHDGNPGGMICTLAKHSQRASVLTADQANADPIFAAIEADKAARAVTVAAVGRNSEFERELQANGRLREKARRKDERRQEKEIEAAINQATVAEADTACALLNIRPTTLAGVIALLDHARDYDIDGMGWPDRLVDSDWRAGRSAKFGDARTWQYHLIAHLAEVLPGLVPTTS
jgi:hypothetical protein